MTMSRAKVKLIAPAERPPGSHRARSELTGQHPTRLYLSPPTGEVAFNKQRPCKSYELRRPILQILPGRSQAIP